MYNYDIQKRANAEIGKCPCGKGAATTCDCEVRSVRAYKAGYMAKFIKELDDEAEAMREIGNGYLEIRLETYDTLRVIIEDLKRRANIPATNPKEMP